MKKVIALQGTENTGKSGTIIKAFNLLKEKYPSMKIIKQRSCWNPPRDICVILSISGIKVGIESQGDPTSRLPESLDEFAKADCDIIICATRTYGKTVESVKKLSGKGYKVELEKQVKKTTAGEQAESNLIMSRKLLNYVVGFIG